MEECNVAKFPKVFQLDDTLNYSIRNLKLRGAIDKKGLKIFFDEIKRNKNFSMNLKYITVSKDLQKVALRYLKDEC